ncbi:MAG: XrtA system polysaccharide chain length determinant [Sedimenticola sp.]
MQELISQLFEYIWGVWRRRWMALIVAWLVAVTGWIWVTQLPDKYLATARVHVDSNQVLRPLLRGLTVQPDVNQRVSLMSRTLLTRPNLEKLMRMSDLDLQVKNDEQKDALIDSLKDGISLSGDRRNTSLYSISFSHSDRQVAKTVVQSLITVFIESTLGKERKESTDAHDFLDKQIADYEQRLVEAENRLADFKRRHVGVMPGETEGYYQRLEAAVGQLNAAKLQLREAENRQRELQRQIEGEEPVFLSSDSEDMNVVSRLDGRINELNRKLDNLLVRYTERHPEVIQITGLIEDLEAEREEEIAAIQQNQTPAFGDLNSNPVYQQMRSMLAETKARVAEYRVRVNEYSSRVETLESKVDSIPKIEAELQQLNRDYEVISQQHGQLLKRRESARLSGQVEKNVDDVKFRVIDPPFVPLNPTEPNKLLLNALVLIGGLGAGIGISFLLSLVNPVVTNRRTLSEVTGLPVLGSVMLIQTAAQKSRGVIGVLLFSAMSAALLVAFAIFSLMHGSGAEILESIKSLRAGLL